DIIGLDRTLQEYGVQLASVTEPVDNSSPIGRFNFRSIASVAELEREMISERTRLGMYGLASQHRWPNKFPPLGYSRDSQGCLCINDGEAKLVSGIYRYYLRCN